MKNYKNKTLLMTLTAIIILSSVHVYLLINTPAYAVFMGLLWVFMAVVFIREEFKKKIKL